MKAKSFLEKLTTKEKRNAGKQSARTHVVRGPFLGRMELVKQLTAQGLAGHMELGEGGERERDLVTVCLHVHQPHTLLSISVWVQLSFPYSTPFLESMWYHC